MAIKVIKHGESKFRITCPVCGCEFEYEFEDLIERYGLVKQVKCPDCGEWLTHKDIYPTYPNYPTNPYYPSWPKQGEPITIPNSPYITWGFDTANGSNLDCDKCPNKPDPLHPVVGDTPCTICKKNQPYCTTTAAGTTLNTYSTEATCSSFTENSSK